MSIDGQAFNQPTKRLSTSSEVFFSKTFLVLFVTFKTSLPHNCVIVFTVTLGKSQKIDGPRIRRLRHPFGSLLFLHLSLSPLRLSGYGMTPADESADGLPNTRRLQHTAPHFPTISASRVSKTKKKKKNSWSATSSAHSLA